MRPLARTGIGVTLACGVLVTAVSVGRSSDSNDKKETPRGPYVALGDSYTSGPKIPPQNGNPPGCDRSGRNYPAVIARELGIKTAGFRDVSCSGATIGDLTAPQTTDHGTNPAQLSALSAGTKLVTLGIGGNDIGFSSLITSCVTTGALYKLADRFMDISDKGPCEKRYTPGGTDKIEQKIDTAGDRLAQALKQIKRRAPEAQTYVVGYPAILPAEGTDCGDALPLAPDDLVYLRNKEKQLNAMLHREARTAGAAYVDTFTPSARHNTCSPANTRWIEPLRPSSPAAVVHPNARGEQGMATAVLRAMND